MKYLLTVVLISTFFLSAPSAQNALPQKTPLPETKKLNYFVGTWVLQGNRRPSAVGPGGKFTLTEHNEWMDGGFFLVGHASAKTPTGSGTSLAVMCYEPEHKIYRDHVFTSGGEYEFSTGTREGDTWTWNREEMTGHDTTKERYTVKQVSPTSYTFKFEIAPAGADWSIVNEGTATKTK